MFLIVGAAAHGRERRMRFWRRRACRGEVGQVKPIKHANEPMGRLRVVDDFVPPTGELVFGEDTNKVTVALSKRSVNFFKRGVTARHAVSARATVDMCRDDQAR